MARDGQLGDGPSIAPLRLHADGRRRFGYPCLRSEFGPAADSLPLQADPAHAWFSLRQTAHSNDAVRSDPLQLLQTSASSRALARDRRQLMALAGRNYRPFSPPLPHATRGFGDTPWAGNGGEVEEGGKAAPGPVASVSSSDDGACSPGADAVVDAARRRGIVVAFTHDEGDVASGRCGRARGD